MDVRAGMQRQAQSYHEPPRAGVALQPDAPARPQRYVVRPVSAEPAAAAASGAAPGGIITFLFTDIEGSASRWERYPEAMHTVLICQEAFVREAIDHHRGYIFNTLGDVFCAAFASPADAIAAALEIQRAILARNWTLVGSLKVRIAIHSGEAEERDGNYFGPTLNRVARLLAAAHGNQILLTAATQELIREQLPAEVDVQSLGEHRLKDLTRPERIFQLLAPDLPASFPPLRTPNLQTYRLPLPRTTFVGRQQELRACCTLLTTPKVRLLTLVGAGGAGKTRLALQVADALLHQFEDGVILISLAGVPDPAQLPRTVAQALQLEVEQDEHILPLIKLFLEEKRQLLILDGFEHLQAGRAWIAELLAEVPGLALLVTSRCALGLPGERLCVVSALGVPPLGQQLPPEVVQHYDAIRLFVERAQAVRADFTLTSENAPLVAEICARLGGLPLAIELAATRIKLLSTEALLSRLNNSLKLLSGGAQDLPLRHRSLQGNFDWSYDLLPPALQDLLLRLSIFAACWDLAAAQAICGGAEAELIAQLRLLRDNSLLEEAPAPAMPRFRLLAPIREYALLRLESSGSLPELRRRQIAYYLGLAEQAGAGGLPSAAWPERLDVEEALAWARQHAPELTPRLLNALVER